MRFGRVAAWPVMLVAAMAAFPALADAGQKLAIFPIDMSFPQSEEDFFSGTKGQTPEEQRRLDMAQAELKKLLGADGRYDIVDISALNEKLSAVRPFYTCNGCEVDLGSEAKADLVMTGLVDKISETHLS